MSEFLAARDLARRLVGDPTSGAAPSLADSLETIAAFTDWEAGDPKFLMLSLAAAIRLSVVPPERRPNSLRLGDVWHFEGQVAIGGRVKFIGTEWTVVYYSPGLRAWRLRSADGKYQTYLSGDAPLYEQMTYIGRRHLDPDEA